MPSSSYHLRGVADGDPSFLCLAPGRKMGVCAIGSALTAFTRESSDKIEVDM